MHLTRNQISSYNKTLILILSVASLIFLSFKDGIATKMLHAAGALSLLYIVMMPKKDFLKSPAFLIFCALCLFGIMNLAWYTLYKEPGTVFANAYRGPMEAGKLAILSAFIFIALLSDDNAAFMIQPRKWILCGALIAPVIYFIFAMWQHYHLHIERIILSTSHATTAGYVIMSSALLSAIATLKSDIKYKTLLFALTVVLGFLTLFATGTRSVILVYLVSIFLLITVEGILSKKIDYRLYLFFLIAAVAGAFLFKDTLMNRAQEINSDLTHYENNDSVTSIGARLAMYELGLKTYDAWGQSIEQRNEKIRKVEAAEPRLSGALEYIDSHLHNDFIETLSTRGLPGVLSILLVYLSLIYYAVKKARQPCILVMLLAVLAEGLSDVIFFSKSVPTSVFIAFVLLFVFLKAGSKIKQPIQIKE